jgi:hypothetical protein
MQPNIHEWEALWLECGRPARQSLATREKSREGVPEGLHSFYLVTVCLGRSNNEYLRKLHG